MLPPCPDSSQSSNLGWPRKDGWNSYAASRTSAQRNSGQLSADSCGFLTAQFYLAFRQHLRPRTPVGSVPGKSLGALARGKASDSPVRQSGKAPGNALVPTLSQSCPRERGGCERGAQALLLHACSRLPASTLRLSRPIPNLASRQESFGICFQPSTRAGGLGSTPTFQNKRWI